MIPEIRNFFLLEREEKIGDLAAGLVLDFFLEKMAPEFYNQGISDSHHYMKDSAEDLLSLRK
jgi:uncharacterized protein (DUF2164 family)